ncbi:Pyruvoyl-dependent arginine decarboxylase [uncultured archaeon]|nr:Pyruvoyl-dependent arginine decarboxylase [uncultured archaeon]
MTIEIPSGRKGIIMGCPIPYEFFRTTGVGENEYQIHAGSYHEAMRSAGIELGNLIPYTSILPEISREIPLEVGIRRIEHGAEVKVIQAAAHVDREKGEDRATAAILYCRLIPKNSKDHRRAKGLVCEYNGNGTKEEALENLEHCLEGLYTGPNRDGFAFSEKYDMKRTEPLIATIRPEKRFGTALAALAFVSYFIPVLEQNVFPTDAEASAMVQSALGRGL